MELGNIVNIELSSDVWFWKRDGVRWELVIVISLIIQAVQFRRDQMPVMNFSDEVIVFNDKESFN